MQYDRSVLNTNDPSDESAILFSRAASRATATFVIFLGLLHFVSHAQEQAVAKQFPSLGLRQCIDYALKHQPALNQTFVNKSIVKLNNAINLSGWWPQVNVVGSLTHYNQLPTAFLTNSAGVRAPVKTGVVNTAMPQLEVTQAIFSPSLLFAKKSEQLFLQQADQVTDSAKIDLVANVSKSFYNLLLTIEQIDVLKEDTARLDKNLSDTYHQYKSGIVDETDYDEAAIELNNSKSQLKQASENVIPQYATLKQLMGFPADSQFNVDFDTLQMMRDIYFDTTQDLQYEKRIEFQQLQTAKNLQHQLTNYYRNAFLPSLNGLFTYTPEFQSDQAKDLYSSAYPYSYFGLGLSLPIFTGLARIENIRKARFQEQLLEWNGINLKSEIYTEYTTAMANYKSNFYNLSALQDNVVLAKRTYNIVALQYNQGVVPYLNVITAESNLITSEIGYINALFQLLSSKIDLEKAMGVITY